MPTVNVYAPQEWELTESFIRSLRRRVAEVLTSAKVTVSLDDVSVRVFRPESGSQMLGSIEIEILAAREQPRIDHMNALCSDIGGFVSDRLPGVQPRVWMALVELGQTASVTV